MENIKKVWMEYTGGFPEGDYELQREGFVIGNKYQGELHPDRGSQGQVWIEARSGNDCVFFVGENCKLV